MRARAVLATPRPAQVGQVGQGRRMLLGRVHKLQKRLGLDDDTYRDKLQATIGKRSASGASDAELRELLRMWARELPEDERAAFTSGARKSDLKEPFQRLIRALWIDLYHLGALDSDGSDTALDAFVRRQCEVSALRFLRAGDAPAVIEALKAMLARAGVKLGSHIDGTETRRLVVRTQWSRLAQLKAVHVPFEPALMKWLEGRVTTGTRGLSSLSDDQLDAAMVLLGDWIRRVQAKTGKTAETPGDRE